MNRPLVSIICLCYNQDRFVAQTLKSVFSQDYPDIQVIVVDDASTDNSQKEIRSVLKDYPEIPFLPLAKNIGNTAAFNEGLHMAIGKYVIDLSCDDVLYEDKVSSQVAFFEQQPPEVGVIYSDVRYVNDKGQETGFHFKHNSTYYPFEGDVYEKLVGTYFLPTQTMMIRREVFDQLEGYDPHLAYEDFDFWVRSSRTWLYAYQNKIQMDVIKHTQSLSKQAYRPNDKQLHSTYLVCEKIKALNKSIEEDQALIKRLKLEIRQSVFSANYREADLFGQMLKEMKGNTLLYQCLLLINSWKLDLSFIRNFYHRIRY